MKRDVNELFMVPKRPRNSFRTGAIVVGSSNQQQVHFSVSVFCSPEDEIYANHSEVTGVVMSVPVHNNFIVPSSSLNIKPRIWLLLLETTALTVHFYVSTSPYTEAKQHSIVTALQTFIKHVMHWASKPYVSSSYYRRWFKGMSNNERLVLLKIDFNKTLTSFENMKEFSVYY